MTRPLVTLSVALPEAEAHVIRALEGGGFRITSSMRVDSACAPVGTDCPHQPGEPCACQVSVLTFHDWNRAVHALVIHAHGGRSAVMVEGSAVEDPEFSQAVRSTLDLEPG